MVSKHIHRSIDYRYLDAAYKSFKRDKRFNKVHSFTLGRLKDVEKFHNGNGPANIVFANSHLLDPKGGIKVVESCFNIFYEKANATDHMVATVVAANIIEQYPGQSIKQDHVEPIVGCITPIAKSDPAYHAKHMAAKYLKTVHTAPTLESAVWGSHPKIVAQAMKLHATGDSTQMDLAALAKRKTCKFTKDVITGVNSGKLLVTPKQIAAMVGHAEGHLNRVEITLIKSWTKQQDAPKGSKQAIAKTYLTGINAQTGRSTVLEAMKALQGRQPNMSNVSQKSAFRKAWTAKGKVSPVSKRLSRKATSINVVKKNQV